MIRTFATNLTASLFVFAGEVFKSFLIWDLLLAWLDFSSRCSYTCTEKSARANSAETDGGQEIKVLVKYANRKALS